jgi:DNA polymerase III alpha subunit (gram-positive type)
MRYFVLDTETTGISETAEAWEIAIIACDEDGTELDTFRGTCKPQTAWEEKAREMSGLTDEELDSFQSPDKLLNQVTAFIKANAEPNKWDNTIVCHNVAYDMPLLARMYDKYNVESFRQYVGYSDICTMQALRMLKAAGRWDNKSCALQVIHEMLGTSEEAHTALADVKATAELFFSIKRCFNEKLDVMRSVC